EPGDLVAPAVARGQQQDRHGAPRPPPRLQHRDAVHLRQADVEDDRVIRLAFAEVMAFLAVEGAVDHVARVRQRGRELTVEIGVVLDDQESHCSPPARLATQRGSALQYGRRVALRYEPSLYAGSSPRQTTLPIHTIYE